MAQLSNKLHVFSGVQPTGRLHLGNYIGALSQWVENQGRYGCIYSIVDLHALTSLDSHRVASITEQVRQTAALLIACGLDPERSTLFVQSHISAHAELAWILNCLTPVGWLDQMLRNGAQKVLPIELSTLDKVKRLTGIERPQPGVETMTHSEGAH